MMTYLYVLYKDFKSVKGSKGPDKAFTEETEKIFIVLLVVATAALLMFFFIATLSPRGISVSGQSFGGASYAVNVTNSNTYYHNSSNGMMYYRHSRVFTNY